MSITNNLFKLTFPDGWKETTVYTFEGPHDSGVQHNLVLTVLPGLQKDVDLQTFAKHQTETSAGMLPGFELVAEKPAAFFNGANGVEITYSYRPTDEIKFIQKQWYFAIRDKVYLFTATFNKKTVKTIATEVEGIIRSLRIDVDSKYDLENNG
ncbi:MAG: DcrB-related protein [Chitinispirillaceae bacterium]|nr:DcrB-related protein [Chitinispirillaceae bacterium]